MNTAIKSNVYPLKRVDNEIDMSNPAETCTAPASHLIERLEAEKQLAEWHKVFGHLSKDADTAGNMINEGIADNAENARKQAAREALEWMIQNYCINERMENDFCTKFGLEG